MWPRAWPLSQRIMRATAVRAPDRRFSVHEDPPVVAYSAPTDHPVRCACWRGSVGRPRIAKTKVEHLVTDCGEAVVGTGPMPVGSLPAGPTASPAMVSPSRNQRLRASLSHRKGSRARAWFPGEPPTPIRYRQSGPLRGRPRPVPCPSVGVRPFSAVSNGRLGRQIRSRAEPTHVP